MTCPKCSGPMKTFDRLGVHVEQCANCRGIFLDFGELEQIVAAESRYDAAPPPLPSAEGNQRGQGYGDRRAAYRERPDSPAPYRGGYEDSPRPYGSRRRKSIFEQLFD